MNEKEITFVRTYDAPVEKVWKAWTEGQEEESTIDQTTELTLTEENGKTKVEVRAVIHKTSGPRAGMAVQGMEAGFTQQLEKLDYFLAEKK